LINVEGETNFQALRFVVSKARSVNLQLTELKLEKVIASDGDNPRCNMIGMSLYAWDVH